MPDPVDETATVDEFKGAVKNLRGVILRLPAGQDGDAADIALDRVRDYGLKSLESVPRTSRART